MVRHTVMNRKNPLTPLMVNHRPTKQNAVHRIWRTPFSSFYLSSSPLKPLLCPDLPE